MSRIRHSLGFSGILGTVLLLFFTNPGAAQAQSWSLREAGVGIYNYDSDYDKTLKIVRKGASFSQKELYEMGAFSGRMGPAFGGWISGPPVSQFSDPNGNAVWLYSYVLTYPNGQKYESGKSGFYSPGFGTFSINTGGMTGNWKLDFFIWNKKTSESRKVQSIEFTITP